MFVTNQGADDKIDYSIISMGGNFRDQTEKFGFVSAVVANKIIKVTITVLRLMNLI
jgi:hypothetical protein